MGTQYTQFALDIAVKNISDFMDANRNMNQTPIFFS